MHGKNDRRAAADNYRFAADLPPGDLTSLLLIHIKAGRAVLTLEQADDDDSAEDRLFVSRAGIAFSNATFTQYWGKVMGRALQTHGITYFPPSKARTIFVEAYLQAHAADPELWEGAAAIMGNTPRQWRDSYTPNRKRRLIAQAVQGHGHVFCDGHIGGGGAVASASTGQDGAGDVGGGEDEVADGGASAV